MENYEENRILIEKHIVKNTDGRSRLKDYAAEVFSAIPSKKGIVKAVKRGELLLNNEKAETGRIVKNNDELSLYRTVKPPAKIFKLTYPVLYEDESLAVICKPAGFEVNGNKFRTIENSLPNNLSASGEIDALPAPTAVHRLDYSTSGLLLIAKTKSASVQLSRQFHDRTVGKKYTAVIMGKLKSDGEITTKVDNRTAHSSYKTLQVVNSIRSGHLSLVELIPHTGRKHQLRVHMKELGCPILGDPLYAENTLKGKGLFLCSTFISFTHPKTDKKMSFEIEPPAKFHKTLARENELWCRHTADKE